MNGGGPVECPGPSTMSLSDTPPPCGGPDGHVSVLLLYKIVISACKGKTEPAFANSSKKHNDSITPKNITQPCGGVE